MKYPLASCLALAKQLKSYGYKVTIGTDAKTKERAEKELKGFEVREVTDDPAVEKLEMQWCHTTMTSKAPALLGLLVLSGHGRCAKINSLSSLRMTNRIRVVWTCATFKPKCTEKRCRWS